MRFDRVGLLASCVDYLGYLAIAEASSPLAHVPHDSQQCAVIEGIFSLSGAPGKSFQSISNQPELLRQIRRIEGDKRTTLWALIRQVWNFAECDHWQLF